MKRRKLEEKACHIGAIGWSSRGARPALHREPKAAVYKAIKSGEPTLIAFINGAAPPPPGRNKCLIHRKNARQLGLNRTPSSSRA